MVDRFLPGVPGEQVEKLLKSAPGNEIDSGKIDSPRSSAALAANTFGFFLCRVAELPTLPGCEDEVWPADSLTLEKKLPIPKIRGIAPHPDALVTTGSALIGIESKRFEPFDRNRVRDLPEAYWQPVWGEKMPGYQRIRDNLRESKGNRYSLDATQLFRHALGLRTAVNREGGEYQGLKPILFYIYAEPSAWPDGLPVAEEAVSQHQKEIAAFAQEVNGDEVKFVACSYRQLLEEWVGQGTAAISRHAAAVLVNFKP